MDLIERVAEFATAVGNKIKAVEATIASGGGSGGVQNVFIQESEPTIDVGTSALWIQQSADGSITFNLVEN